MLDLTEIPGFLRLYSFRLAVVLDAFTRAPLAARVFFQEPTGHDVAEVLTSRENRLDSPGRALLQDLEDGRRASLTPPSPQA